MAVTAQIRSRTGMDVEVMWGDEGFVVRFPDVETPPDPALLLPDPDDVEGLVLRRLGATSLFAARFRETAARARCSCRGGVPGADSAVAAAETGGDLLAVASRVRLVPGVARNLS